MSPQVRSWTSGRTERPRRPQLPLQWGADFEGQRLVQVELYTRSGCHLCDDATQLLRDCGVEPRLVDIDARPELLAEYDQCVPVVVIDGRVRFRGKVDPVLLRRLLQAGG